MHTPVLSQRTDISFLFPIENSKGNITASGYISNYCFRQTLGSQEEFRLSDSRDMDYKSLPAPNLAAFVVLVHISCQSLWCHEKRQHVWSTHGKRSFALKLNDCLYLPSQHHLWTPTLQHCTEKGESGIHPFEVSVLEGTFRGQLLQRTRISYT